MNADVDGDVYCRPTVCVAYPPNRSTPAMSPARTSIALDRARVRAATGIANGASTSVAIAEATERGTRTA